MKWDQNNQQKDNSYLFEHAKMPYFTCRWNVCNAYILSFKAKEIENSLYSYNAVYTTQI